MTEIRVRVLLVAQSALLGTVGPRLRAVTVSWSAAAILARAFFDGLVSDADRESISEAETIVMSHFPDRNVSFECVTLELPAPIPVKQNEVLVFMRRE